MRTITDHVLPGLNEALVITVLDQPGHGGACHIYTIDTTGQARADDDNDHRITHGEGSTCIQFQNGPIQEHGVNGISGEALLAIVIDRLCCFQAGPYSSIDNQQALNHCREALYFLQKRTKDRVARGVEGTSAK